MDSLQVELRGHVGRSLGRIQSRKDAGVEVAGSERAERGFHLNPAQAGHEKPATDVLQVLVLVLILVLVLVMILFMMMAPMVLVIIILLVLVATKQVAGNEPAHVRHEKPIRDSAGKAGPVQKQHLPDKRYSNAASPFTDNETSFARSENASTGILLGANEGSISHLIRTE